MSNGLAVFSSSCKALATLPACERPNLKMRMAPPPPARFRLTPLLQQHPQLHPPPRIKIEPETRTTNATDVLRMMDSLQLSISADMYTCLIKECTDSRDAASGSEVHSHMINSSGLCPDLLMLNRLLQMYALCSQLDATHSIFDGMPVRDSISWAILIAGHMDNGEPRIALKLFMQMMREEDDQLRPTVLILVCVLKACVHVRDFNLGKQVHGWFLKRQASQGPRSGLSSSEEEIPIITSLISFYGRFGRLDTARRVFNERGRNCCNGVVLWTALIVSYCKEDCFEEVVSIFKEMGKAGRKKNHFTYPTVLRACGRLGDDGRLGRQVHAEAIKVGVESDVFVQSSLVDMYGRSGLFKDARKALEIATATTRLNRNNNLHHHHSNNNNDNIVCWNAMLTAYTSQGCGTEAIKLLHEMKAAGIEPQESMLNQVRIAFASAS